MNTKPKLIESSQPPPAFPTWPSFSAAERLAVDEVLRSGKVNYWTGQEGGAFEREYAEALGVRHALSLANGTVALELAMILLDIKPGDEVITTPRTYIASASAAILRGARVVFADVDPDSQNITPESIEAQLSPRTRAIVPVHLAGWPCDMEGICALAARAGIPVIEDCAQAHGALIGGRPVGSFGAFGAFSFCQDKIITTGGEGGLLAIQSEELWARGWAYKDHGKSYEAVYHREHGPGFRWLHESFGTNWRMTEIQAVIGRLQLRDLENSVARRRENARILHERLVAHPALRIPEPPASVRHSYYKFYAFLRPERLRSGWSRDQIVAAINTRGVPCFSGSCPEIYLERCFEGSDSRPLARLPNARLLGETSLMFLVHPTLTPDHMNRFAEVACEVLDLARA